MLYYFIICLTSYKTPITIVHFSTIIQYPRYFCSISYTPNIPAYSSKLAGWPSGNNRLRIKSAPLPLQFPMAYLTAAPIISGVLLVGILNLIDGVFPSGFPQLSIVNFPSYRSLNDMTS